jgi:tetratricopeptide (TPR) repeat protein
MQSGFVKACVRVGCWERTATGDSEIFINASWVASPKTAAEVPPRDESLQKARTTMKEPTTEQEVMAFHNLLRSDPQRCLQIVNAWIEENPASSNAYFDRHLVRMQTGEPRRALEDLNKAIELQPDAMSFMARGEVYRHLGEYEKALVDFNRAEAIDPEEWEKDIVFGLLYQADCHARLGNEPAAMASCERLRDDFWTPGINNTPSGGKADVAAKVRIIAADARRKRV